VLKRISEMKKEGSLNNIDLWSWILGVDTFNSGKSEKEKKQDATENIKMLRALDRFGKHLYNMPDHCDVITPPNRAPSARSLR
jgi:hypothetical protein